MVLSDGDDSNEEPLSAGEDEGAAAKRVFGDSEVASVSRTVERSPLKPAMTMMISLDLRYCLRMILLLVMTGLSHLLMMTLMILP